MKGVVVRKAKTSDEDALYAFARSFPELRVSATHEFMDRGEFGEAIQNPDGVFLCAIREETPVGFIYANANDVEKKGTRKKKWACLVYVAVEKEYRGQGIATRLYTECIKHLKSRGVTHCYGWANNEDDGAVRSFMEKHGFAKGHTYVWMDKEL